MVFLAPADLRMQITFSADASLLLNPVPSNSVKLHASG